MNSRHSETDTVHLRPDWMPDQWPLFILQFRVRGSVGGLHHFEVGRFPSQHRDEVTNCLKMLPGTILSGLRIHNCC